jgi:hypothetical protein
MRGETDDERAARIRRGREVLSGGAVTPPDDPIGYGDRFPVGGLEFRYFLSLSILVVLSAIVWAIWGMGPATPLLILLALGLLAGWVVL